MDTKYFSVLFLVLGCAIGYTVGLAEEGDTAAQHRSETSIDTSSTMHAHPMHEVEQDQPIPTVQVEAVKDEKDGFNLHILTTNYRFTPETVNTDPVSNTGHAHLYVNGVKIARLYSEWFNVSAADLVEGENVIEVTLNANDHSEWVENGQHIADTITVIQ